MGCNSDPTGLIRYERHQGHVARALNGRAELALVSRAGPACAPRQDLAALRDELLELGGALVVDTGGLLYAEGAHLATGLLEFIARPPAWWHWHFVIS